MARTAPRYRARATSAFVARRGATNAALRLGYALPMGTVVILPNRTLSLVNRKITMGTISIASEVDDVGLTGTASTNAF